MTARLRLILVALILVPITLALIPVQFIAIKMIPKLARRLPVAWHRLMTRLIGIRVIVKGQIPKIRPVMIVSNHVSWMDIPVLGSVMDLCFIAKTEVGEMPVASLLAKLQRSVFVTREDRRGSGEQAKQITGRMLAGDVMVLFAEGTTGDGHRVHAFKSSLFGAAQYAVLEGDGRTVYIQPVAIAYTRLYGMPLGRYHQAEAAWPGNLALLSHARNFLLKGAYDVEVSFGEPIAFERDTKRRKIAADTRKSVRALFNRSMRQRGAELL